ncbi:AraC family transcriptional regulator [Actinomadura sp. NBRC 104412]|uniref:helix-turn-helix domain-containing protein n=1 Tax=Actinomadura sp. NBRC 104412 TaxID=3032203 RepID=UPI0024A0D58C|nr:helix-turn-helix domain-containing protein [Actinomadura sp. NBRC 104412]GLZ09456.1 AraC family transcriptional regulator [Actinomadura sp. NBRC 104412]
MSAGSVALVAIDDMPLYELAIAWEVFGTARPDLADPWYDLRLCAVRPGGTRAESGFMFHTPYGLDDLCDAETVIVPALPHACLKPGGTVPAELTEALGRAAAAGSRMVSLCSGAFALAAAGLLDGRRATTHWQHADTLARRHPDVQVDSSVLYVDEGDVLTSAGRSAGLDLCLHLVRRDLGAYVANQVARRMVVPAHRSGGQSQYIETPMPRTDKETLAPVLDWACAHLAQPLTVDQLARRARMSPRTFVRRFHSATGTTPLQWLLTQRLNRARALLESTRLPIDEVSRRSGLGTAANLRRHFRQSVGVTPTDYRTAFLRS